MHLVTDYLFFLECFTEEYLLSKSYQEFCSELYHAYDCVYLYMEEKYHIVKEDYEAYPSEYYPGIPYEECILPKEMADAFIDRVSSIDLATYIEKIKLAKKTSNLIIEKRYFNIQYKSLYVRTKLYLDGSSIIPVSRKFGFNKKR